MHTEMNENTNRPIIYFGNDWRADNRTSSHHIARRLAQRHQVYYIECPGIRAPRHSRRDLLRIVEKVWRSLKGPREVMPGLRVKTLLQVPLHRFAAVRWLNARLIRWSVRWLMWRNGIRRPVSWFVLPHVAGLVGQLGEALSVYYCIDDYASLPDVDAGAVRAMDEILTREADLVFVASDTLLASKAALNPNTYHSPHGVDSDHFGHALESNQEIPRDVRHLSQPVIGFFGLIERWVDLDLIAYLAKRRPKWSFLMIGRVAVSPAELPQLPNVHFIGKRPYEQLPAYGRLFAAAILPFRLTKEAWHANPLKLREYLAMGKPVVSVRIPEAERFTDVIEIAEGREDFLTKLDQTLKQPQTPEIVRRRAAQVAHCSWESRVNEVLRRVDAAMGKKHGDPCVAEAVHEGVQNV